jgi:hypothetical protein
VWIARMVIRGVGICRGTRNRRGRGRGESRSHGDTASMFTESHTQSPSAVHGHPTLLEVGGAQSANTAHALHGHVTP